MRVIRRGLPLLALAMLLLLVACDGDGDATAKDNDRTPSPTATGNPGGSDADYVQQFCTVEAVFGQQLVAAAQELLDRGIESVSDPAVLSEVVVPPLHQYIEDLRVVNPPSDVRPYHDDLIVAAEAQVQLIETGRFDAERLGVNPFGELVQPPPAIQARLAAVAATTADCDGVDSFDQ